MNISILQVDILTLDILAIFILFIYATNIFYIFFAIFAFLFAKFNIEIIANIKIHISYIITSLLIIRL